MHIFANFCEFFLHFAGTKSRGTKSGVELIVAQNSKTKSPGNLMSRKIRKKKVAGTESREVAQCFEKKLELKVAGTKNCGTKSRVELIVAQNFKTKSREN